MVKRLIAELIIRGTLREIPEEDMSIYKLLATWAKAYGFGGSGESASEDEANQALYIDDGYILVGSTSYYGTYDCLVLKINKSGIIQWAFAFGSTGGEGGYNEELTSITKHEGNYILVGYTQLNSDALVIKINNNGNIIWAKKYGGSYEERAYSVLVNNNSYLVAGSTVSYSSSRNDVLLLSLDYNGNIQWAKAYGGQYYDRAYNIKNVSDGYLLIGESNITTSGGDIYGLIIKTDFSGNLQWAKTYGLGTLRDSIKVSDGYIIIGARGDNILIIKTDFSGNLQWAKTYGTTNESMAYSIISLNNGYAIIGYSTSFGNGDILLLLIDNSGNLLLAKTYGGDEFDTGKAIINSDNGYIIVGGTRSFGAGNSDVLCIRTDEDFNITSTELQVNDITTYIVINDITEQLQVNDITSQIQVGDYSSIQVTDITSQLQIYNITNEIQTTSI